MTLILSIDSGTQSSRCKVYDDRVNVLVSSKNVKHNTIAKYEGWSEQNINEMEIAIATAISEAVDLLKASKCKDSITGIGITNQRETIVAWDSSTGEVLYDNTIVWNDNRTMDHINEMRKSSPELVARIEKVTGLKLATYFSASKMQWMILNIPAVKDALDKGTLKFGTVDSFIIYRLSGNKIHCSDVTNCSRTLLFDITTKKWCQEMCDIWNIPIACLPNIVKSGGICARVANAKNVGHIWQNVAKSLENVAICGILGDQQASTLGHGIIDAGGTKFTIGTGGFILMNCGASLKKRPIGCTVSPLYDFGDAGFSYCIEGSIGSAGIGLSWIIEQGLDSLSTLEETLTECTDSLGVIFIPAFTSLLSPYWKDNIKASIHGLTLKHSKKHVVRAFLESLALIANDILIDMEKCGVKVSSLHCDGGMAKSHKFLEILRDFTGKDIYVPTDTETTARGAAIAALIGLGELKLKDVPKYQDPTEGLLSNLPHTDVFPIIEAVKEEWNKILKCELDKC